MAKLARGAVIRIGDGAAPATVFQVIPGLADIDYDPGSPQFAETTDHATAQGRTSRIPTHLGEGTATAKLYFDGLNAVHAGMLADMNAFTLKSFQIHDPTSGSPGTRDEFTGYIGGLPKRYPVSGLAEATLTISIEPPVTTVSDT